MSSSAEGRPGPRTMAGDHLGQPSRISKFDLPSSVGVMKESVRETDVTNRILTVVNRDMGSVCV